MSILKLLYFPNDKLRIVAKSVKKIDNKIKLLTNNMIKTMYTYKGIGLAATQIGVNKRIIVIDVSNKQNNPLVFINPTIIVQNKTKINNEEGCLSIPQQKYFIYRYKTVKVQAKNLTNKNFEIEANNLLSYCLQHEIDHLNGILFIDYLSNLKYQRVYKKMKKFYQKIIRYKKNKIIYNYNEYK
ncbi:peptide deformylase [Enterobacteriaceae endosymbiont of Plateumaris consimilis]|uniref:peptide deformylase n=1 Tax=Enterobacteriaceae endosymbiont of Plateumaris consimilis TaxID=2675794 RepID=UPI0014490EFB|nr:peptide deformylase [Enterobacteriaceae endosymbiont of Plateumaris consimilis]QJC28662.1 peptide deformylase [Enterobacteriaceae endosymbiont of Plateumaris consimilis]